MVRTFREIAEEDVLAQTALTPWAKTAMQSVMPRKEPSMCAPPPLPPHLPSAPFLTPVRGQHLTLTAACGVWHACSTYPGEVITNSAGAKGWVDVSSVGIYSGNLNNTELMVRPG